VLLHDLLLSKQGIAIPLTHGLRQCLERHKARLNAEFTKARLKAGYHSIEAAKAGLASQDTAAQPEDGTSPQHAHPRWVRINTLSQMNPFQIMFKDHKDVSLAEVCLAAPGDKVLALDEHIPNLIALPPGTDVTRSPAYLHGDIILQDKASCFSAYLLNPSLTDGDLLDACAAPGNKTTHLAAILHGAKATSPSASPADPIQTIYACERDKLRAATLAKMTAIANPDGHAHFSCLLGQDFLRLSPQDARFKNVGALLLDPSCSGSGIVRRRGGNGRSLQITLPAAVVKGRNDGIVVPSKTNGKRKREATAAPKADSPTAGSTTLTLGPATDANTALSADPSGATAENEDLETDADADTTTTALETRLSNLAAFQLKIVTHAFSFPSAGRVVYSTCSIHAAENESVVINALRSPIAIQRGWRVLRRSEQVEGMRKWKVRGKGLAVAQSLTDDEVRASEVGDILDETEEIAEACIRCEAGTAEGTMGFFVVGFVREEGRAVHVVPSTEYAAPTTTHSRSYSNGAIEVVDLTEDTPTITATPTVTATPPTANKAAEKKKKKTVAAKTAAAKKATAKKPAQTKKAAAAKKSASAEEDAYARARRASVDFDFAESLGGPGFSGNEDGDEDDGDDDAGGGAEDDWYGFDSDEAEGRRQRRGIKRGRRLY